MASSPPGFSPPQSHLSLPKKRPSLSISSNPTPNKRRKASIASVSAHPLRQTSFPPQDRHGGSQPVYSPAASGADEDLDIDDEIHSAVGSHTGPSSILDGRNEGIRRGRGGGKRRGRGGRAARSVTGKSTNGESSTVVSGRRGAASTVAGGAGDDTAAAASDGSGDEEDDENAFASAVAGQGGNKLSRQALEKQKEERAIFLDALPAQHLARYDLWNRVALKRDVVRRLVNQTLSQSVPSNVVMTVNAYTKVFAGEIVDRARLVQREWVAAAETLPTGETNVQGLGEGETSVAERDLGPLTPDHLREALRRYRRDGDGGTVGFTGHSLEGREGVAARNRGRKLFK